ncbi:ATP-binding protein [Cryobacterium sp. MLB-32]|uniref:ATP-binding protein n=1 Tax=Cryobacterium sp. MLB-32 TaxID=1529318 RepID=UPI001E4D74E6|nr:ATP-binding protein [Cryobacterium sp. MLB-32]
MRTERMSRPRLRLIGGVCVGFAEHTGLDVGPVRVAAVLLAFCGGAGVLFYAWLWATTPSASAGLGSVLPKASLTRAAVTASAPAPAGAGSANTRAVPAADAPRTAPLPGIVLGVALLVTGTALLANRLGANISFALAIPTVVVLAGVYFAWRQFADLRSGAARSSSAALIRTLGALLLTAVGIVLFFVTGANPSIWTVLAAAVSVLLGLAIVTAPWFIRLSSDLADERAARAREAERADIAAHLHDSVLQTLALIQQKAGPHSEAARLARAQERELREWLFIGPNDERVDLATELRRAAILIEADCAVHFDVVTTGDVPAEAPEPLLAAAREAMFNAARHAGGTVSVYLECGRDGTQLSVIDRGPGFRLHDVPDDRFGVRESILGRMRRAGGTAAVGPGPGGSGTEIVLSLPAIPIDSTREQAH